jgi:hypothetical protein
MYAMKSRFLLILLAVLYAGAGAWAATVAVTIDGQATTYTLNGLSIDGNGNASVSASSIGDGEPPTPVTTYTLSYTAASGGSISGSAFQTVSAGGSGSAVTATASTGYAFADWSDGLTSASRTDSNVQANLSVTANFSAVVPGNCPTPGSNVQVIDTGVDGKTFPATTYSTLAPNTIQAFKFVHNKQAAGSVTSTKMTAAQAAKTIVISECPGQILNTGLDASCTRYSTEVSYVYTATGYPTADPRTYCRLEIGKVYYANMVAQAPSTLGSNLYTCSSTANCGHYAYLY